MFIDGLVIKKLRKEMGMSTKELSKLLWMTELELTLKENGANWFEKDYFRLTVMASIFEDPSLYILT